jgi:hypothetical protein
VHQLMRRRIIRFFTGRRLARDISARHRAMERHGHPGRRISLPARRLIAAAVALVLVLLALGMNAGGNGSFGYSAELAVSEPRLDAVITAERWWAVESRIVVQRPVIRHVVSDVDAATV